MALDKPLPPTCCFIQFLISCYDLRVSSQTRHQNATFVQLQGFIDNQLQTANINANHHGYKDDSTNRQGLFSSFTPTLSWRWWTSQHFLTFAFAVSATSSVASSSSAKLFHTSVSTPTSHSETQMSRAQTMKLLSHRTRISLHHQ